MPSRRRPPTWLVVLAAIGVLAVGSVTLDLIVGVGRRTAIVHTTEAPPAGTPEFLRAVAGTLGSPARAGGTATLLHNGREFFPALEEAMAAARHTIDFSVFIWEDGRVSDRVSGLLAERARAGVQVRVLLDGFGSASMSEQTQERMRAAGVRVSTFRPLRFGKLTRFHKRNHRRAIVMDGTTAFTGGMAVGDKWLGDAAHPDQWRDTMVKLTGPPAAAVQSAFADVWAHSTGELLAGDIFFPPLPPPTDLLAPPGAAPAAERPLVHIGLTSAPSSEDHPISLLLVLTVTSARHKVYATTPYFVPDRTLRRVLADRARAGVDVRLLLPGEHTDAAPVRLAGRYRFQELLAAGVRIWEYQPTMLHSKGMVVDGIWSLVGSANLNLRSRELDHENLLGIAHPGLARQMEEGFLRDLASAREITLEQWRQRGAWERTKEWASSVMAQVF